MNVHERESYQRMLKSLHRLRSDIIKEAKAGDRERVGLVKHLNPLIRYLHELLGESVPKLEKVPKGVK